MSAWRSSGALACLVAASWIGAACVQEAETAGDVSLELFIDPSPPRVGPAKIEVKLSDAAKAPVRATSVRIEGNMNHAGMVPEIAQASEVEPGRYAATIELTMGGDWFVIVDAALADGRKLQRTVQVPSVSGE
jgi:hypothetical protein